MKTRKKLFSAWLAIALLCSMLPAGVCAADNPYAVSLSAAAENAALGETVDVFIDVAGNATSFNAFYAALAYSSDIFTYTSCSSGFRVDANGAGELKISRVGGNTALADGPELTLQFTAIAEGAGSFSLNAAKVDVATNAERDAAAASLADASCVVTVGTADTPVTGIGLDRTSLRLKEGETATITAAVTPADATDKTVAWSSSDTSVATVSDGVVTAISEGTALIRALAGSKETYCAVTVTPAVTNIILNPSSLSLEVGDTETLTATILPSGAADTEVSWTSLDTSVATVSDGTVKAVTVGATAIIAEADGKTAYCFVTVTGAAVQSVTLDKTTLNLAAGSSWELTATVSPSGARDATAMWTSSNPSVATVSDGIVTGVGAGTAVITATAGGKAATCTVTVTAPEVTGITLNKTALSLAVGSSETLTATIPPSDAQNITVSWTSSNPSVATVSDGVVTGVGAGTAVITATAGDRTASCTVTVTSTAVTAVALNKTSLSLTVGNSEALTATISPTSALNTTVFWTSSNESVAVVSNGVVRAISAGTAVVTATAGGKTATCTVTVITEAVTDISLNRSSLSLTAGNSETLTATVLPSAASGTTVTWTSSNTAVATVSNGVVRAVNAGAAVITATAGGKTATCTVTVETAEVTGITLNKPSLSLTAGNSEVLAATVQPGSASGTTVSWTSSNTAVATVSGGRVTAVSAGTAVITATAGGKTATCTVTVTTAEVTGITLNQTSLSLTAGESETLTVTVLPSAASGTAVSWTSSSAAVATVSNGVVHAIAAGTAAITATAGGKTAVCTITVTESPATTPATPTTPETDVSTDIDLDAEGNKITTAESVQTTVNDDGSITKKMTQSTTMEKPDGVISVTNVEEETTISSTANGDGTVTETETAKGTSVETVTAADGNVTQINRQYDRETSVSTVLNADGTKALSSITTETVTAVKTDTAPNGSETVTVIESTARSQSLTDENGNGAVTERKEETAYSVEGTETTVTDTVTEITTDSNGTKHFISSAVATTTSADGATSISRTETVRAETADGTVAVQVSDGLGNTISGGVLFSDAAVEQAVRSGTAITSPVGYYAAPELEYAAEIEITAPISEGSVRLQLPVLNAIQGGEVDVAIVAYALVPADEEDSGKFVTGSDGQKYVYQLVKDCYMSENGDLVIGVAGDVEICLVDNRKSFDDVKKDSWYEDYVTFVTAREIFNGNGNGTFSPEDAMNRAMVAQVLYNFNNNPKTGMDISFADVHGSDWFSDAVNWAASQGIVNGYSESEYGALDNVTREQLVTMLYRYFDRDGYGMDVSASLHEFNDASDVHDWALEAMRWAVGAGLIEGMGNGKVNPGGNATRAQVAAIMARAVSWTAAR